MRADPTEDSPRNFREASLRQRSRGLGDAWVPLAVHLDAACRAPRPWLQAFWSRIRRKRVRARAQFAPLLAASSFAYRLWLRSEPTLPSGSAVMPAGVPTIVALVMPGAGQDVTIASLRAEGFEGLVLGSHDVPTLDAAAVMIDWNSTTWLLPMPAGDIVAHGALAAYRAIASQAQADAEPVRIIYADDDILDGNGNRGRPHFKPSWNAELFAHFDFLTGSCIVKAERGDLAGLPEENWAARLVAKVLQEAGKGAAAPRRIPHILHHRRSRPLPRVEAVPAGGKLPPVTVIVPTRNRKDLLATCLEGLARTDYPDLEVIVVDNGSDDPATLDYLAGLEPTRHRVLRCPGPFNFSALNNRAAALAKGDLLCLLNNDIEIVSPDWLAIMARQALRPDVGAVGAQLLYPDGRIQHAGVVLGICGGAAHAHRLLHPDEEGYFHRHALPQFVSAVTAACLVVRRDRFDAVGRLDEANFAVAFNDVDLCMKLNAGGWQSLYEPRARLIHHESVSRGLDRDPVGAARLAGELAALKARWNTGGRPDEEIDPYHHPQLNRFSERFVIRL